MKMRSHDKSMGVKESLKRRLFSNASRNRVKIQVLLLAVLMPAAQIGMMGLKNAQRESAESAGNNDITSGLKYANSSREQKALAKKLLETEKDAVVDPATGYVVCGKGTKYILPEPIEQIKLNGHTIEAKRSYIRDLIEADKFCKDTKKIPIIVFSSSRSNVHSLEAANKRADSGFIEGILQSDAAKKACGSDHNRSQGFDVLNFDATHECLVKFGFNGGWAGGIKDPHHYGKPKEGGYPPVLSGRAAIEMSGINHTWCITNDGCRRNNLKF